VRPSDKPVVRSLHGHETEPATMFDPPLTYWADGTALVMRARGEHRRGIAAGRIAGHPYDYQVVRWADGSTDNVAPHVLHPVADDDTGTDGQAVRELGEHASARDDTDGM
jgi:hypothetical protein